MIFLVIIISDNNNINNNIDNYSDQSFSFQIDKRQHKQQIGVRLAPLRSKTLCVFAIGSAVDASIKIRTLQMASDAFTLSGCLLKCRHVDTVFVLDYHVRCKESHLLVRTIQFFGQIYHSAIVHRSCLDSFNIIQRFVRSIFIFFFFFFT